jgi:hypothetical protein
MTIKIVKPVVAGDGAGDGAGVVVVVVVRGEQSQIGQLISMNSS